MRAKVSRNWLIIGGAAIASALLTVIKPSPQGLLKVGLAEPEVRAAPGAPLELKKKHNLTKLEAINQTLIRIRDNYVDPSRIDPKEMLYSALDYVQFNIPEVLVEPDRDHDEVTVVVSDKKETFSTADVDSFWRLSKTLKKVFRFIEANINPGADLAAVEYAAANGMLSTLDPHSVLLDPELAREMDLNTGGEFGGLGIVIGMRSKKLTVLRPMPGTPAMLAGIKARDHIVKIDDEVTENLTLNESVDRMRGKPGTGVTLWIERKGESDLLRFDIVRGMIKVESVKSKMLGKNVGYLKINQFASRTTKDLQDAMATLKAQGAQGWILDLRWNPGGLLEQAIKVSDLFVDRGTIVTTVGGHERDTRRASRKGTDTNAPIVVLVNNSSASASEIVAGALKNLDRALIVGSNTFGKGSVQILYDNKDDSKLKLTIAQYLTPGDLSIQTHGIAPDIELLRMSVPDQNKGPRDYLRLLEPSHRHGEGDLKSHLSSDFAREDAEPEVKLSFVPEPRAKSDPSASEGDTDGDSGDDPLLEEEEEPMDDEIYEDFEIQLARDLLASVGKRTRSQFVKASKRFLDRKRVAEIQKLSKKLAALGVDWAAPEGSGRATALDAHFELAGNPNPIRAGSTVQLVGTVKNVGDTPAYRVHARVKTENRLFSDRELIFGKIEPGQSKSWTTHIKIPDAAVDRLDYLSFDVTEARGAKVAAPPLKLRMAAADQPVFAYSHQLLDLGNGDGLVQPGESVRLRVEIKNTGKGVAKDTSTVLRNASGVDLLVQKARFELGELKPGESKAVEFAFKVSPKPEQEDAVVELSVYDNVLGESVVEKLSYPLRKPSAGPSRATGGVSIRAASADIHEGASADSNVVATGARGTKLRVTGKQGDWLRVDLGDSRAGFVRTDQVTRTSGRPRTSPIQPRWQVTPPELAVNVPSYETASAIYELKGVATDDSRVEDVYIFVSNFDAKIENRKVFYKSNRGGSNPAQLSWTAQIPLWPGSNAVTVVARENNDVKSAQRLYLYRTENSHTASASP